MEASDTSGTPNPTFKNESICIGLSPNEAEREEQQQQQHIPIPDVRNIRIFTVFFAHTSFTLAHRLKFYSFKNLRIFFVIR